MSTKINEGSFGSVYRPPISCNSRVYTDEYVGKITAEEDVEAEMRNGAFVRKLDPDGAWSITALQYCEVNPDNVNEGYNYQLIYRYGGKPLVDLMMSNQDERFDFDMLDNEADWGRLSVHGFDKMVKMISDFLPNLEKLNDLYQHNDMHLKNLVYDVSGVIRIIDFATLIDNRDLKKRLLALKERQYMEYGLEEIHMGNVIEDLERVVDDDVKQTDILYLFKSIMQILESPWGKAVLNRKYKYWITFHRKANTYEKLMEALRVMPKSS